MAEKIKKYLDNAGAQELVNQIKAQDAATLQSAKDYADSLADNYDTAGSANTALTDAKKYTDEQIKEKADAKGAAAAVDAKLTTEVNRATGKENEIVAKVEAVESTANANKTAIETINNADTGILAQAKADATTKANAVQAKVDTLDKKVGTLPTEGTKATSVVEYIDEKTKNIASDTVVSAISDRVTQAEKDIDAIEKDYLKAADKTALEGKITTAQNKADAAQTHSEGVATDLANETQARKDADNAQVGRIATLEDKIKDLNGAMHFKGVVDTLPEDVSSYKAGDVVIIGEKEYVFNGTAFAEFGDVSAEGARIGTLETKMTTAQSDIEKAKTNIASNTTAIGTKADATALASETKARTDADSAMDTRLKAVEGKFGEGEGSVSEQIKVAKQAAIDTASADATKKAGQALTDAKAYADAEDAKIESRVDALEANTHTHANKAELDKFETGDKAKLDSASTKAHEHTNKTVLDGINADKVKAWDAAEKNAKGYADTEVAKDRVRLDAVEAKATANASAVATKAEQSALDAAVERITKNEAGIAENLAAINSFARITEDEIKAMFNVTAE